MKDYHGSNAPGSDSETYGRGGQTAVCGRNPNSDKELNDAPEGPFAHALGLTGDGGIQGTESSSSKGMKFYFK